MYKKAAILDYLDVIFILDYFKVSDYRVVEYVRALPEVSLNSDQTLDSLRNKMKKEKYVKKMNTKMKTYVGMKYRFIRNY